MIGRKGCGDRIAVGAIAIEQDGGGAIEGQVPPVEDRDRHAFAICRRREKTAGHILFWIVTRWDDLALAQDALMRREIIVVDFPWRRHRRIGESQDRRVIFETFLK